MAEPLDLFSLRLVFLCGLRVPAIQKEERMFLDRKASKLRIREAENARRNRQEIIKALSDGQVTRRDLFKWGLFTVAGRLVAKQGLNPFVGSAYGGVPTGFPRSPVVG